MVRLRQSLLSTQPPWPLERLHATSDERIRSWRQCGPATRPRPTANSLDTKLRARKAVYRRLAGVLARVRGRRHRQTKPPRKPRRQRSQAGFSSRQTTVFEGPSQHFRSLPSNVANSIGQTYESTRMKNAPKTSRRCSQCDSIATYAASGSSSSFNAASSSSQPARSNCRRTSGEVVRAACASSS